MVIVFDRYSPKKRGKLEELGFRCVEFRDRVECYKRINEIMDYVVVLEKC
jgi:hypothetical protein